MWKKRELRVHNNGIYDLAKEVIKQWNTDGRPRGDMPGVEVWADVLVAHQQQMLTKNSEYSVSGIRRKK